MTADTTAHRPRMPEFFIVGHAKCGTTALYEMLNSHPGIYMPEYEKGAGKEPWYFACDNPHPQTGPERDISYTGRSGRTEEEYLSLFAGAREDQIRGEASTSYLWSPVAAQRIAAARPDAKIVGIFREPASFLRSLHLQLLQNHHENQKSFRRAVELDADRLQNRNIPPQSHWPRALIYSERVRYVAQLQRFHAVFAPEQILTLIYDDFRADNEGTVKQVLRFLGADDTHGVEPAQVNPTVGVRSVRMDEWRRSLRRAEGPVMRTMKGVGTAVTTSRLRKRFYYPLLRRTIYGEPPPPDEEFMLELRRRFKGEVVALSEFLGRDLVSLWGYDRLG